MVRPDLTLEQVEEMGREEPGSAARYLEERRDEIAAEKEAERERDDYQRFEETFVAAGGERSAAKAAYKDRRNENARIAAARADEAASEQSRRRISQAL